MSVSLKPVHALAFVALVAVGALLMPPQPVAHAEGMDGASVFVKMTAQHNPRTSTIGMDGTVIATTSEGIWLQAVTMDGWTSDIGNNNNKPYENKVFIPWSSVGYVKVK